MRTLNIIGIGAGDPGYVTTAAITAMNETEVFLVMDKGDAKAQLTDARIALCERFIDCHDYTIVEIPDPPRDRDPVDYDGEVRDWHARRVELLERALLDHVPEYGRAAILAWGDPSLYDSTLRLTDAIAQRGIVPLKVQVIPGITAVQALTARHAITVNRIGEPIVITTGRRLHEIDFTAPHNVVVMLDAKSSFRQAPPATTIYWGAYLGTPDELLVTGLVGEVADRIDEMRAHARQHHGWIMDTYLLRGDGDPGHTN